MSAKSFCLALKWILVGNVVMMGAFTVFLVLVTPNTQYQMKVPQIVDRVFSLDVENGKTYMTTYLKAVRGGMALAGRMLFMAIQVCLISMVGSIIGYGLLKKATPSDEGLGEKGESAGAKR